MRVVSWNVNGIRACARHGFVDFLGRSGADIVGVQEVRALPEEIPPAARTPAGWHAAFSVAADHADDRAQRRVPDAANNDWKQEHPKYAGRVFARLIEADQRLSAIKERTRINRSEEKPIHPLQALDFDPDRERDTSNPAFPKYRRYSVRREGDSAIRIMKL